MIQARGEGLGTMVELLWVVAWMVSGVVISAFTMAVAWRAMWAWEIARLMRLREQAEQARRRAGSGR